MTVRIEPLDARKINRELRTCTEKVVIPKGEYILNETIHIPSGKRIEGSDTTVLMAFRGTAFRVHEPCVRDPVTGFHVGVCPLAIHLKDLQNGTSDWQSEV